VAVSREETLMGTAGGLALARERGLLGADGPVLLSNGDCRLDLDLEPLVARHRAAGDLVTLALRPHPDPRRWSRVVVGETDPSRPCSARCSRRRAPSLPG
jgi:NDP-sugar pyrophosphorylase family protein